MRVSNSSHRIVTVLVVAGLMVQGPLGWIASAQAQDRPDAFTPSPSQTPVEIPKAKGAFLGYRTAVTIAVEQHPMLKKSQETSWSAQASAEQAKARYYPQIDAYAIQTGGTIRPLSGFNIAGAQNKPTSYVENAGLRADQLIYDFGQTGHTLLAERANHEATEKDLLTNKALVILRVQQAYLHCLRMTRLIQIAEATVRERGVLRDQIKVMYEQQLKSKLDLDFISIELKSSEVQFIQVKNELRAAFAELNHAMGVRGPEDYTLEEVAAAPTQATTLESLIQHGLEDRPELMGSSNRIRAADEQYHAARALNFPTISATGMTGVIHFSDAPTNQYGGAHDGFTQLWWGAAAVVSVPLFTGFLIENRVAEALQQKYKEEQRKLDLANKVALEITDSYFGLQTAQQQIKVAEKEVESARSALTLAKERYRLALSSIVEVTTATTELLSAEVRLAEARYAVHANSMAVAYAIGKGYREF
jgi:outer membrane protein